MRFHAKRRAAGLCEWCGIPAVRRKCETCEQRARDYQRAYAAKRRAKLGMELRGEQKRETPPMVEFLPTQFLPGTEERIRVIRARIAAGFDMFHPDDAKLDTR